MVQKLGLENHEELSDLINQTGVALSQLKKQYNSNQPVVKQEKERKSQDTFFLSRLADFPMDKQMRIDRCRELLNELGQIGIKPETMENARMELKIAAASFAEIERKMSEASAKYRALKKLEHNLTLAGNPRFTHGPLFDEAKDQKVARTIVDTVDQLQTEDREMEETNHYDLYQR